MRLLAAPLLPRTVEEERERPRHWIERYWNDVERVMRRNGASELRIATLKREVLGRPPARATLSLVR